MKIAKLGMELINILTINKNLTFRVSFVFKQETTNQPSLTLTCNFLGLHTGASHSQIVPQMSVSQLILWHDIKNIMQSSVSQVLDIFFCQQCWLSSCENGRGTVWHPDGMEQAQRENHNNECVLWASSAATWEVKRKKLDLKCMISRVCGRVFPLSDVQNYIYNFKYIYLFLTKAPTLYTPHCVNPQTWICPARVRPRGTACTTSQLP